MAHRTVFAGLAAPDFGDDEHNVLNAEFIYKNPDLTDQFLKIGAMTHRHDGHAALPNPTATVSLSTSATGGTLDSAETFFVTYTVIDQYGGETLPATAESVTTADATGGPVDAIQATVDNTAGILPAGSYAYAETYTDGLGGETVLGPTTWAQVDPGFASAQITLGLDAVPAGAVERRLWRSYNGEDWRLAVEIPVAQTTYVDDGFNPPDNPAQPPESSTFQATNQITAHVPSSDPAFASATQINVYLSNDESFASPSLYTTLPIASAGATLTITSFTVSDGRPPAVSTSIPGAAKIDPDTELVDWTWKRPVGASADLPAGDEKGSTRLAEDTGVLWFVQRDAGSRGPEDWEPISGTGLLGRGLLQVASGGTGSADMRAALEFVGSAGTRVTVSDLGGGSALVTIQAPGSQNNPTLAVGGPGASPLVAPVDYLEVTGSAGAAAGVVDLGGGSARIVVSASGSQGPAGAPAPTLGVEGPSNSLGVITNLLVTPVKDIKFSASGGLGMNVVDMGGGSASIAFGAAPSGMTVAGSGGTGKLFAETYIEFAGSGGTGVTVQDLGQGSARVLVSAPPPGQAAFAVESGSSRVTPISDVRFTASGGIAVAVSDLGGGSAQVTIGANHLVTSSTQASGYVIGSGDVGAVVESASAATAVGYLIAPFALSGVPVGAVVEVFQYGTGPVTIVPSAGVTLRSDGGKTKAGGQFATLGLRHRALDEWVLSGDLA